MGWGHRKSNGRERAGGGPPGEFFFENRSSRRFVPTHLQHPHSLTSIIAVPVRAAGLAPEAASLPLDAAPLRLALAPDGSAAAVALAGGAVARLDLTTAPAGGNDALTLRAGSRSASTDGDSEDGAANKKKKGGSPSLSPGAAGRAAVGLAAAAVGVIPRVLFRARSSAGDAGPRAPGAGDAVAATSPAEVKALAFSSDGATLAAGGDDGVVRFYAWPGLALTSQLTVGGGGVRDVDWARDDCIAIAHDDGAASVWSVPNATRLATLSPPAGLPGRATIARIRFDPTSGGRRLLAAVNAGGKGWVVAADADAATPPTYTWTSRSAFLPAPITAFDVSRCGRLVGGGSADGDVALADARTLARRGGEKRAHMVFVTAVAFQRDAGVMGGASSALPALLSVSADASARVTRPRPPPPLTAATIATLLLAILIALLFLAELIANEPACRTGGALARCTAAGRARTTARADAVATPLLAALRDVAVASGVIGRFPGGDRGEL